MAEETLSKRNEALRLAKANGKYTGTALDKTIALEADNAALFRSIESAENEMKYWKNIGKLVENKVSLGQSILSNITSQVKAGLYFENAK